MMNTWRTDAARGRIRNPHVANSTPATMPPCVMKNRTK